MTVVQEEKGRGSTISGLQSMLPVEVTQQGRCVIGKELIVLVLPLDPISPEDYHIAVLPVGNMHLPRMKGIKLQAVVGSDIVDEERLDPTGHALLCGIEVKKFKLCICADS